MVRNSFSPAVMTLNRAALCSDEPKVGTRSVPSEKRNTWSTWFRPATILPKSFAPRICQRRKRSVFPSRSSPEIKSLRTSSSTRVCCFLIFWQKSL